MRFAKIVGYLKPIGPVVVGISLGFTLSLLSVSWVDDICDPSWKDNAIEEISSQEGDLKAAGKPNSFLEVNEDDEDVQPRIIPYKQVNNEGQVKKPVR